MYYIIYVAYTGYAVSLCLGEIAKPDLVLSACSRNPSLPYCGHEKDLVVLACSRNPSLCTILWARKGSSAVSLQPQPVSTLLRPARQQDKQDALKSSHDALTRGPAGLARDVEPGAPVQRDTQPGPSGNVFPVIPSEAAYGSGLVEGSKTFEGLTDERGILYRPRGRSPFSKPGLWEPEPSDPHTRDETNKDFVFQDSVGADWLNGQIQWNGHWSVPLVGAGGTDGYSAVFFPTVGTFTNIFDDYE